MDVIQRIVPKLAKEDREGRETQLELVQLLFRKSYHKISDEIRSDINKIHCSFLASINNEQWFQISASKTNDDRYKIFYSICIFSECESLLDFLMLPKVKSTLHKTLNERSLDQFLLLSESKKKNALKRIDLAIDLLVFCICNTSEKDLSRFSEVRLEQLLIKTLTPMLLSISTSIEDSYQSIGLKLIMKLVLIVCKVLAGNEVTNRLITLLGYQLINQLGFYEGRNLCMALLLLDKICTVLRSGELASRFLNQLLEMGALRTKPQELASFGLALSSLISFLGVKSSLHWNNMQPLLFNMVVTTVTNSDSSTQPKTVALFCLYIFLKINEPIKIISIVFDNLCALIGRYELHTGVKLMCLVEGEHHGEGLAAKLHNLILQSIKQHDLFSQKKLKINSLSFVSSDI